MPLIKRTVEPVNLSRGQVGPKVSNELECVTNNTLANVIRQLSSLSKHAEDMFGELFREANSFFERANHLQNRVDTLKKKVTRLDSTVEEVSLKEIDMRKPFKSSVIKDSQVITPRTMPLSMLETYKQCDAPPALSKLNPYREDGKDSMKFYTDTTYFFELWCQEIQKDTELQKKELRNRRQRRQKPNKGHREQKQIKEVKTSREKYQNMAMGKEFIPEKVSQPQDHNDQRTASRPNSLELSQTAQNQITADQDQYPPYQGQGQTGQINYNQGHHPNGHAVGVYNNDNRSSSQPLPQYQSPPTYNNALNNRNEAVASPHIDDHAQYRQSPSRSVSSSRTPSSIVYSPSMRPSQPPPAPPGGLLHNSPTRSLNASRESLPPPPPPPPQENIVGYVDSPVHRMMNLPRDSPAHQMQHTPSPTGSKTPDSIGLPPPPPPPPHLGTPDSSNSMPPPPPTPPPPEAVYNHNVAAPPPPPPLPPTEPTGTSRKTSEGGSAGHLTLPTDTASISSTSSGQTTSSASTNKSEKEPEQNERSGLLAAIRTGIQLRKVEKKEEQKKTPQGGLDVQSIMEAAFEMRRKALEANDSDSQDSNSEGEWESDEH